MHGARAYNGGLGAEPPAGSRSREPGGVRGKPPEVESFSSIFMQRAKSLVFKLKTPMFGPWGGERPTGPTIP